MMELAEPTVHQQLAVTFNYGGHGYELASTYMDTMGHVFKLDTLAFILSGIRAEDDGGVVLVPFAGEFVANAANATNTFLLGDLTAEHLHQLRFLFGLDPGPDQVIPSLGSELAAMYCGTDVQGHHFLKLTGQVDGNGDGLLAVGDPRFSFMCTGPAMVRTQTVPVHSDLLTGSTLTAVLSVDIEELLAGIDLLATPSSDGNVLINAQLMDQLVMATTQTH
ncbi:MAG: hypothetical protein JNL05_14105 [Flavobacteriales bacterium]|nr:hypothetical protein [Flavobacteriales bacterium]